MKLNYKKLLMLIIGVLLSVNLMACGSTDNQSDPKISIGANTTKTLINEQILITADVKNLEDMTISWSVRLNPSEEWEVVKTRKSNTLYLKEARAGIYEVQAKIELEDKEISSNILSLEYVEMYGQTLGMSPTDRLPSNNVDFSKDDGSANAKIVHGSSNKIADEYAFFKNIHSTQYVIEAEIDIIGINGSDPYPKSGLIAAQLNDRIIYFAFDARPTFDFDDIIIVEREGTDSSTWRWPGTVINRHDVDFRGGENGERTTHKLTVIRNETEFFFLFDGQYLTRRVFPELTQATLAGTFTMAQHAEYSNYYAAQNDPNNSNDLFDQALKNVQELMKR